MKLYESFNSHKNCTIISIFLKNLSKKFCFFYQKIIYKLYCEIMGKLRFIYLEKTYLFLKYNVAKELRIYQHFCVFIFE